MADADSWGEERGRFPICTTTRNRTSLNVFCGSADTDNFEPDEPIKKAAAAAAALDRWEGEDEEEDVKVPRRPSEWSEQPGDPTPTPTPTPEEQLDEKLRVKKLQEESDLELTNTPTPTPEEQLDEKLRVKKLQEESDLELTKEAFGVANNVTGIDTMSPSSKDDFAEFEKLLKEKISSYEKSVHYSTFLESLFRDLCLSLEVEDLKKISNALTVLLSEKQKQEKQSKAKKKKKGVVPGGGLKATLKDDLEDYGGFQGGYGQEFEDFM
uniref:Eukaryotic translation initiation factor 3 subunit J n=1 Tax=Paramormyrops kingsleyae TaxID=1676925 RepID=A0A3B3T5H6_9TELE